MFKKVLKIQFLFGKDDPARPGTGYPKNMEATVRNNLRDTITLIFSPNDQLAIVENEIVQILGTPRSLRTDCLHQGNGRLYYQFLSNTIIDWLKMRV